MKITLLVVGKTTDKHIQALTQEYLQRLSHYLPVDIEVIPELRQTKALSQEDQKQREAKLILQHIKPGDHVALLDEHGDEPRSIQFAQLLQKRMASGVKRLLFIVGGPYGFAPEIYARADEKISLSRLTFSHQMVRLFFVEQVYRAMTILNNEPYHHE
ncbi:MAG: 23S rRNA (pseudouridine(1915)-N(3))-methyltransferase RlmH [Bacteroidaceae bacterium]|nr:23S rRNA (pseudouridine(1915)-N(3))-methyltransferase RlmH [Bacteroidaceae bacterium]